MVYAHTNKGNALPCLSVYALKVNKYELYDRGGSGLVGGDVVVTIYSWRRDVAKSNPI